MKEKIDILIDRRRPRSGRPDPRRGPVKPNRKGKPLGRRRKLSGGIRFFDLGYKQVGGSWQTVDQYALASLSWSNEILIADEFDPAAADALLTQITAIPKDLWTGKYKQIKAGNSIYETQIAYRFNDSDPDITRLSESPNWNGSILQIPDSQNMEELDLACTSGLMFEEFGVRPFDAIGERGVIITSILDPDAVEVVIPPTKQFDVFLMPRWVWFAGTSVCLMGNDTVGSASAGYVTVCYLNYLWSILDRRIFLDPTAAVFGQTIRGEGGAGAPDGYPDAYEASLYGQTINGTRSLSATYGELRTTTYGTGWLVGNFPPPPAIPPTAPPTPGQGYLRVSAEIDEAAVNRLQAVIKVGSTFYYCWSPS